MNKSFLKNRTFDEIQIGETATLTRVAGQDDTDLLTVMVGSGNSTAAGSVEEAAKLFDNVVTNGIWTGALVSAAIGSKLPGPGTVYLGQDFRFLRHVKTGDSITAVVRVTRKLPEQRAVILDTTCTSQDGEVVLTGTATVLAPYKTMECIADRPIPVPIRTENSFKAIIKEARNLPRIRAAIVHPCSPESLLAAIEVRDQGLFDPVLVGPEDKIRTAAKAARVSLDDIEIVAVPHSHAAVARAVDMAVSGKISVLVKGSLHTDELLAAVVAPESGLKTERRISHVFALDVPAYDRPLIVTDAAINIQPTLEQKRDICQNAIDLLHTLGVKIPHVAVLAAVETVNPKMPTTLDAAALTVMAARGQITGAKVDGPLAFDNAISIDAARTKGIISSVAGTADILLVPDLEAGNMLAKQLIYFAGATAAGVVLGARVPIVLTSRADPLSARIASAALARLMVARSQPAAGRFA